MKEYVEWEINERNYSEHYFENDNGEINERNYNEHHLRMIIERESSI